MLGDSRASAARRRRRARAACTSSPATLGVEVDPEVTDRRPRARGSSSRSRSSRRSGEAPACSSSTSRPRCSRRRAWRSSQNVLGRLKAQGQGVIFITHKLHEALTLGDRIPILARAGSRGRSTASGSARRRHEELRARDRPADVRRGGRAPSPAWPSCRTSWTRSRPRRRAHAERDVLLELRASRAAGERTEIGIEDVSLELHEGEILGVAGVDGNGQRALAEVGRRAAAARPRARSSSSAAR